MFVFTILLVVSCINLENGSALKKELELNVTVKPKGLGGSNKTQSIEEYEKPRDQLMPLRNVTFDKNECKRCLEEHKCKYCKDTYACKCKVMKEKKLSKKQVCRKCLKEKSCKKCQRKYGCECGDDDDDDDDEGQCNACLDKHNCSFCRRKFGCKECNTKERCERCLEKNDCMYCNDHYRCECDVDCDDCLDQKGCDYCSENFGCKCTVSRKCRNCLALRVCKYCERKYHCNCKDVLSTTTPDPNVLSPYPDCNGLKNGYSYLQPSQASAVQKSLDDAMTTLGITKDNNRYPAGINIALEKTMPTTGPFSKHVTGGGRLLVISYKTKANQTRNARYCKNEAIWIFQLEGAWSMPDPHLDCYGGDKNQYSCSLLIKWSESYSFSNQTDAEIGEILKT